MPALTHDTRSGDAAVLIDGASPGLKQEAKKKPRLQCFLACVACAS
jgi:hypothetical protein